MSFFYLTHDEGVYRALRDKQEIAVAWLKHRAMVSKKTNDPGTIITGFRDLSLLIEAELMRDAEGLRHSVGIVDLRDYEWSGLNKLNPLSQEAGSWPIIVSMLILAFPEIHWIFNCSDYSCGDLPSSFFREVHLGLPDIEVALELREEGFLPLFDPTGLRDLVRREMREPTIGKNEPQPDVRVRDKLAAAIDDEEHFAFFSAHTAYRFGYRSHVVTSYRMLQRLFGGPDSPEHVALAFEDLSLMFADKPPEKHFFKLKDRDKYLPALLKTEARIIVTAGAEDKGKEQTNEEYVRWLVADSRCEGKRIHMKLIYKPVSGFFDLWRQSELGEDYGWAPYIAPSRCAATEEKAPAGHHGVPGRILLIAEQLTRRAETLLRQGTSVEDCIHGSVLAMDALTLMGNRTPTLAIEALALKHELELSAECMFYGLRSDLDVTNRWKELDGDVEEISRRFHYAGRKRARLDAEIGIVNRLIAILRANDRFDEEQEYMTKLRSLRRHLSLASGKWSKLFGLPRWYAETLINSFGWFLFAIVVWLLVGTVFYFCTIQGSDTIVRHVGSAFFHAVENFISAHPPDTAHELLDPKQVGHLRVDWILWFTPFFLMLGFFHVGIFIAYIYSKIVRKVG